MRKGGYAIKSPYQAKQLRKRRKANKVAKQARKRNRGA